MLFPVITKDRLLFSLCPKSLSLTPQTDEVTGV